MSFMDGEKSAGCKELLRYLSEADIRSLCETVTNRLVVPTSYEEAIEAIALYSKSPEELLGRKKVKAESLLQYLLSAGVAGISPKSSKTELVSKTVEFWNRNNATAVAKGDKKPSHTTTNITYNITQISHNQTNNYVPVQEDGDGRKFAEEFVNWFYSLLNNLTDVNTTNWNPNHFWPDASLQISILTESNEVLEEQCKSAEAVCNKLSTLVLEERIFFNPNMTSNGYRGVISPHGLAKVAVCGSLHKHNSKGIKDLVGVFEQLFCLLRDVNDGNRWKMKQSQMKMRVAGKSWQPTHIELSEETIKSLQS